MQVARERRTKARFQEKEGGRREILLWSDGAGKYVELRAGA